MLVGAALDSQILCSKASPQAYMKGYRSKPFKKSSMNRENAPIHKSTRLLGN